MYNKMKGLLLVILLLILITVCSYFVLRPKHVTPICVPNCLNKDCGPDGCGGQCPNNCSPQQTCDDKSGTCICNPNCAGKSCGPDGCGGSCGTCGNNQSCNQASGQCECIPSCSNKDCGDNGCGGSCGTCSEGQVCQNGTCQCIPNCSGKSCGPDGCGGECPNNCTGPNQSCNPATGQCDCLPNCVNKMCGPDGCGGQCTNKCAPNETCNNSTGQCVCTPNCPNGTCGPDGCGGTCSCPSGDYCNNGVCCTLGKCNANCPCPSGQSCQNGVCCSPSHNCDSKYCGDNGCGEICNCLSGYVCQNNSCVCATNPCGNGRVCGTDGCGNVCGNCGVDQQCVNGSCLPTPATFTLSTTDNEGNTYALFLETSSIPASGPIPVKLFNMSKSQPGPYMLTQWTYDPIKHSIIAVVNDSSYRTLALTTSAPANEYCQPYPKYGDPVNLLIDTDYLLVVDDYLVDSPRFERWMIYSDGTIVDTVCGDNRCLGSYSYNDNTTMFPTTTAPWPLQCRKFTMNPAPPVGVLNPNASTGSVLTCPLRDGSKGNCPLFDYTTYSYGSTCSGKNVTASPNPNWVRIVNDFGQSLCGVNPFNQSLQSQCCSCLGDSCFDTSMSGWCNQVTPNQ